MHINYSKAIQESEEDLTELEQRLRGQKAADRVRTLRLLKSGTVNSLRVLCAAGWLQCGPADPLVATLPDSGLGRGAQAAQASREGLATDCGGVGGLDGRDARGSHRDHARRAQLSGARMGHPLQERQVPVVAVQETPGQVEDRAETT